MLFLASVSCLWFLSKTIFLRRLALQRWVKSVKTEKSRASFFLLSLYFAPKSMVLQVINNEEGVRVLI